jgi:hypothetical protein
LNLKTRKSKFFKCELRKREKEKEEKRESVEKEKRKCLEQCTRFLHVLLELLYLTSPSLVRSLNGMLMTRCYKKKANGVANFLKTIDGFVGFLKEGRANKI